MHKSITSAHFTVHSGPSPLLGETPFSEDPETSVPPSWVSVIVLLSDSKLL